MKTYLVIFTLLSLTFSSFSQPYNFPIKPGTKEWNACKTEQERLSAIQIPDTILNRMSTNDLIISCVNYPAFGHYTAFNSLQNGFDFIHTKFNGIQELLAREDAGINLLKSYQITDINNITNSVSNIQRNYLSIRFN